MSNLSFKRGVGIVIKVKIGMILHSLSLVCYKRKQLFYYVREALGSGRNLFPAVANVRNAVCPLI